MKSNVVSAQKAVPAVHITQDIRYLLPGLPSRADQIQDHDPVALGASPLCLGVMLAAVAALWAGLTFGFLAGTKLAALL